MTSFPLETVQRHLQKAGLDGWLFYDFKRKNAVGCDFLGIPTSTMLSRRFFYWVPAHGIPKALLHRIESHALDGLPGERHLYGSWEELETALARLLAGVSRVAMEYSPNGNLPTVSTIDGGTLERVRRLGIEVVSSAELLVQCMPPLSSEAIATHRRAADVIGMVLDRTWGFVADHVGAGVGIDEWEIQEFILGQFSSFDVDPDHPPICAVNAHSADPHYVPLEKQAAPIRQGDWLLIDLWCKETNEQAIFADVTKVAVIGRSPSDEEQKVFQIVRAAREAGIAYLRRQLERGDVITGAAVDRQVRQVITEAGYADYFIHRTGHNIGTELHGAGSQLDDYETHDDRPLLPGCCFSIEPGIYLPDAFGVRLECNALILPDGTLEVTGNPQDEIVII